MLTRRSLLAAGATAAFAATAGCLDFLLGDDLSFEATPASVASSALSETGYEEREIAEESIERTFEAAGESRTVDVTNWRARYDKSIDFSGIDAGSQRAATFTVYTTPKAEVLGETFNPVGELSAQEIVEVAQDTYEGISNLERKGEETVTLLGESTTATRYSGDADLAETGLTVDVELQVTEAVSSGDDFALVICGYPERLADSEREDVHAMLDGVQHDG